MKRTEWPEARLDQHCEILSGYPFAADQFTEDPDGVSLVKGENVGQGEVLWGIAKRWPRGDVSGLERFRLVPGDVVLAMDRPWVPAGLKFARIPDAAPDALLVQRVARLRARAALDQSFLPFVIGSPSFVAYIQNTARGVGVPHVSAREIGSFQFPLPPIAIQKRISGILSAYDDLIENNRRRMALLEQAARLLYEEWFVRLRFPGHEHTRIVNGLPEGWERVPLAEAIDINPKTSLSDDGEHWYVEMSDLSTDSMVIQNAVKRSGRTGSKFRNGDTLLARITPCLENGKTGFVDFLAEGEAGRGSTEFIVLRSKRVTPEFVYCLARTYAFRENAIKSMIGSSGRQRVQESCLGESVVWVPAPSALGRFAEVVRPLFGQVRALRAQNHRLRAARDLLLPRLMSGEVEV